MQVRDTTVHENLETGRKTMKNKSRLLLGSPGWSVGCFHAENDLIHRKMVVNCPIMITSKVKPFSRQNYTGKGE